MARTPSVDNDVEIERPDAPFDRAWVEQALEQANLPSIAMSLYQLTGEERWLEPPFRPTAPRGTSDHDSGGLPDDVQRTVRAAAADAIIAWSSGREPAVPRPDDRTLHRMMSIDVAEDIPDEYAPLMSTQMGFSPRPALPGLGGRGRDFTVLIVGAGLSGLLSAYRVREAGMSCIVVEREDAVGGVWRVNGYPGAGVDTPSDLYSLSFFPRDWSRFFAKRDEVREYFEDFADAFALREHIRFRTEVTDASFDAETGRWHVSVDTPDGPDTIVANAVISAVGVFSEPKTVHLPGQEGFEGALFHSSLWPEGLDVTGKDVVVVGSGASAMQIVPMIAGSVRTLSIFQRAAQWSAPAPKYWTPVTDEVRWLMGNVPYYRQWYRFRLHWMFNDQVFPTVFRDPEWPSYERSLNAHNERHRASLERYIRRQLEGREDLLDASLPAYPPYGKRMLIDNGWFEAIKRPNVHLIGDGVAEVTAKAVRDTAGRDRPADVVVLCTGFHSAHFLRSFSVHGRDGVAIHDLWGTDDARAHLGVTVAGFPNFFVLYGPNVSGTGGSYMSLAETQVDYIVRLLARVAPTGSLIEPTEDAQRAYNETVEQKLEQTVWVHPAVTSYYRNERGRPVMNSPWSVLEYWNMTLRPDPEDFLVTTPAP